MNKYEPNFLASLIRLGINSAPMFVAILEILAALAVGFVLLIFATIALSVVFRRR